AEFRKRDIHIYPIGIGTAHGVPLLSVLNGYKKISDYPEDLEKDWAGITTRLETGTLARLGRETDGRPPFLIENKEMSARDYMKGIIGFHRSIVLEPSGDDVREDQELWWQILCAAVLLLAVAILFDR
ncbi:MAG: hypothetical protein Q8P49_01835, partial [Candidatus Liptonbacteria bacterium]|nr:hypothetical protein [Candidatus Liptonbacteria bacterium]